MVQDPYKTLDLEHDAQPSQIKKRYRDLARRYHPDRLVNASEFEQERAVAKFASISEAYALLSDARRKAEYDHVYKFGGYDDEPGHQESSKNNNNRTGFKTAARPSTPTRGSKSVGYSCTNPFAFAFTNGRIQSTRTVAGVSIPSRLDLGSSAGLSFAFSCGEYRKVGGQKMYKSHTTRFVQGRKVSRVETTTIHPDGRKEVVINDDGHIRRHVSPPTGTETSSTQRGMNNQWTGLWHDFREKLGMCHNPCAVVTAQ